MFSGKFFTSNEFVTVSENIFFCYSQPPAVYEDMYNEGIVDKLIFGYPTYEEVEEL